MHRTVYSFRIWFIFDGFCVRLKKGVGQDIVCILRAESQFPVFSHLIALQIIYNITF